MSDVLVLDGAIGKEIVDQKAYLLWKIQEPKIRARGTRYVVCRRVGLIAKREVENASHITKREAREARRLHFANTKEFSQLVRLLARVLIYIGAGSSLLV